MTNVHDSLYKKIKIKRTLLKLAMISVTILLSPILLVGWMFYLFIDFWNSWRDSQYIKIEDARMDLLYLKKYNMTYKEYYID